MQIVKTIFDSVLLIEPKLFVDNRGFFFESYNHAVYQKLGIDIKFIQDNHSLSNKAGTIRGMHFQADPNAQCKLIRVIRGEVINYFVDIRKNSPTYKKFNSVKLSAENKRQLFIPAGFANGFKTLKDDTEVLYKVDKPYSPQNDRTFRFDDSEVGINWEITEPILSDRDKNAPTFAEVDNNFIFEEGK